MGYQLNPGAAQRRKNLWSCVLEVYSFFYRLYLIISQSSVVASEMKILKWYRSTYGQPVVGVEDIRSQD